MNLMQSCMHYLFLYLLHSLGHLLILSLIILSINASFIHLFSHFSFSYTLNDSASVLPLSDQNSRGAICP